MQRNMSAGPLGRKVMPTSRNARMHDPHELRPAISVRERRQQKRRRENDPEQSARSNLRPRPRTNPAGRPIAVAITAAEPL